MSEEKISVVLEVFEAWNAGDMDRLAALTDPDAVVHAPPGWPEPGPFVGREAIMRQFDRLRETFDTDAVEPLSDFQTAGDYVLIRLAWKATGYGPALNMDWTMLYSVRGGRIYGLQYFPDHGEALKAAGLSE